MATNWPYSVDSFSTWANGVDLIEASIVNNIQDSVVAMQAEIERTYRPDLKPASPSAYDDEFETGTLDVKWTAINCALGTVDMFSTAAAKDTYDPTMYRGMMALQPGRDDDEAAGPEAEAAILRQTVALATNCKIIAKFRVGYTNNATVTNIPMSGLILSGVNGFDDNNLFSVWFQSLYDFSSLEGFAQAVSIVGGVPTGPMMAPMYMPNAQYLAIHKRGFDYSVWVGDGHVWMALTDGAAPDNIEFTNANPLTRLSVFAYHTPAAAQVNIPSPIAAFDFVRYFANNTPVVNA